MSVLCLVLGILPGSVIYILGLISSDLGFPLAYPGTFSLLGGIPFKVGQQNVMVYTANYQTVVLITLLGLIILIFLSRFVPDGKRGPEQSGQVAHDTIRGIMQYTSSTFTSPVRDFLGKTLTRIRFTPFIQIPIVEQSPRLSTQESTSSTIKEKEYIKTSFEVSDGRKVRELFREVYNRLINLVQRFAQSIGSIVQNGDLRHYLLYIFVFFISVFIVFIFLTGVNR